MKTHDLPKFDKPGKLYVHFRACNSEISVMVIGSLL